MSYESEFTPLFMKLLARLDKPIREHVLKAIEDERRKRVTFIVVDHRSRIYKRYRL